MVSGTSAAENSQQAHAPMVELFEVSKTYSSGATFVKAVERVSLRIERHAHVALVGSSGSGKTTLLSICAGLETPSEGRVISCGKPLHELDENRRADFRSQNSGFIFQNYHLLPALTALENVLVPAELRGNFNATRQALELLERLGLAARATHYPSQLSGGEQQRVAIARALINHPQLLFADEPTGNLDAANRLTVTETLLELAEEFGVTLVIATHDLTLAGQMTQQYRMTFGQVEPIDASSLDH